MHPPVKPLRMQALWERKNNEPPWVPALVNQPFILAPLSTTHSTSGAPPIPSAVAPFAHHENDMYEQGSVATVKTGNITHTSRRRRSAKPKSRAHAAAIDSPDQRLAFLLASIPLHWQPRRRSRWQIVHAGCRRPTSRGVPDPPPARPDRMAAVERPRGCTQKEEKQAKKSEKGRKRAAPMMKTEPRPLGRRNVVRSHPSRIGYGQGGGPRVRGKRLGQPKTRT